MSEYAAVPGDDGHRRRFHHGTVRTALVGLATFTVAAVTATMLIPSAEAGTVPTEPAQTLAWQPCLPNAPVDCASLSVPIDWSRPAGSRIEVAVARRKATDPAARIGTLVIMPGRPGNSGVENLGAPVRRTHLHHISA